MSRSSTAKGKTRKLEATLRAFALSYPEASEEFPWGHLAVKVRGKAFLFMGTQENELSFSVKLPESRESALLFPYTEPTGYGLGASGWVTSTLKPGTAAPIQLLKSWIGESYRAVAPRKLAAGLVPGAKGAREK